MSDFKLINLTKTNSYIIFSRLNPITDPPIIISMQKLDEIQSE